MENVKIWCVCVCVCVCVCMLVYDRESIVVIYNFEDVVAHCVENIKVFNLDQFYTVIEIKSIGQTIPILKRNYQHFPFL